MVDKSASSAGSGFSFDSLDEANGFAKQNNMRVFVWTGQVRINPIDGFSDPVYAEVK